MRAIGSQAVYDFLKSFYIDESRPFGVNNIHLPNTAMPHVLEELQGVQKVVYKMHEEHDKKTEVFDEFIIDKPGVLDKEEYNQVVVDIVNFLAYLSEPAQLVRKKIGVGVLDFNTIGVIWNLLHATLKYVPQLVVIMRVAQLSHVRQKIDLGLHLHLQNHHGSTERLIHPQKVWCQKG